MNEEQYSTDRFSYKRAECRYIIFFLKLCSLWPIESGHLIGYCWPFILLSGYSYVLITSVALWLLSTTTQENSIILMSSTVNSISTTVFCALTDIAIYTNRRQLIDFVDRMERNFYEYSEEEEANDDEMRLAATRTGKHLKTISTVIASLYVVTILSQMISITLEPDKLEDPFQLVYVAWVPLPMDSLRNFYICNTLQTISTMPHIISNSGNVGLTVVVLLEIKFQIERLERRLNNIRVECFYEKSVSWFASHRDNNFGRDHLLPMSLKSLDVQQTKIFQTKFRQCIRHYQVLLRSLEAYQSWFQWFFSLNLLYGTVTFGLLSYTASSERITVAAAVKYVGVLLGFMALLFTCCIAGECMLKWNQELSELVYHLPWYKLPSQCCKDIYIFLCQTQKPLKFKGLAIYIASLYTFLSIVKMSYSYFNFLRTYGMYKDK